MLESGRPIAVVAREIGENKGTAGNWVAKSRGAQGGPDAPLTESERAKWTQLGRESAELRMQRDVLKRSTVVWVAGAIGQAR